MKKLIFVLLMVSVVMGVWTVPVFAEDTGLIDESVVETAGEAVSETVGEVQAEETVPEDIEELIASATPEQIEQIKQYILAGLSLVDTSATPFWDKVKNFAISHLDALAWFCASAVFVVYFIGSRAMKKAFSTGTAVMNNNAVELAERTAAVAEDAKQDKQAVLQRADEVKAEAVKACHEVLAEARALKEASAAEIAALKARETSCAEALSLMATEINALLQVSSLSEWKRDELQATFDTARAKVEEVMRRESEGENEA